MRDATYDAVLPRLAMLHALEVPSAGGCTRFADMRAAWDALTETMRTQLLPLTGLHRFNVGSAGSAGIYAGQAGTEQGFEDQRHPAVAVHTHNRRPILFVNPAHIHGFDGVEREAGWRLVPIFGTWKPASPCVLLVDLMTVQGGHNVQLSGRRRIPQ